MIEISKWRAAIAAAVLIVFAAVPLAAETPYTPLDPLPLGSTLLSLSSPHVAAAGLWEVKFAHRFSEARGEGLESLWGLDNGANVTMAISYVPVRDLELSLARSNVLDNYELAAKYVVVQQAPAIPLSLSLRAGANARAARNLGDRTSAFVQAVVGRRVSPRVEIFALPTFVTKAGRASTADRSYAMFDHAANIPLGVAFLVRNGLSVVTEIIPPNRDLTTRADPGWAVGIKRAMGGHHFEVLLTNNGATSADQYVTSTFQGAPLESGGVRIGFNIERQFGRARSR